MADAKTVKTLMRQTLRWLVAARQDREPVIAVLHANYAAGYIAALRQVASDAEIQHFTGVEAIKLEASVIAAQDRATERLLAKCPQLRPALPLELPGKLKRGLVG